MTYTVRYNTDGSVTIDQSTFEELVDKAARYDEFVDEVVIAYRNVASEGFKDDRPDPFD